MRILKNEKKVLIEIGLLYKIKIFLGSATAYYIHDGKFISVCCTGQILPLALFHPGYFSKLEITGIKEKFVVSPTGIGRPSGHNKLYRFRRMYNN